jgi:hypothetical protein
MACWPRTRRGACVWWAFAPPPEGTTGADVPPGQPAAAGRPRWRRGLAAATQPQLITAFLVPGRAAEDFRPAIRGLHV